MGLYVLNIIKQTMADGPGLRNSIYLAGCDHRCPGCHNPESWKFKQGKYLSCPAICTEVLDKYSDITISGGDPIYQYDELVLLCWMLKKSNKNIWVYTGFTYEEILEKYGDTLFKYIDALVDGPYIESRRDTSKFKGSKNQRIIHFVDGKLTKIEQ